MKSEHSKSKITKVSGLSQTGCISHPFILSAGSSQSLEGLIARWKIFVQSPGYAKAPLQDICATLMTGRESFPYRCGCLVTTKEEIEAFLAKAIPPFPRRTAPKWCLRIGRFLWTGFEKVRPLFFSGQQETIFKQQLDQIRKIASSLKADKDFWTGWSRKSWPQQAQPLYSLLAGYVILLTLKDCGFTPALITGESSGLALSLAASGLLKLDDALAVLKKQKQLDHLEFARPGCPFHDPLAGQTIQSFLVREAYVRFLVDGYDLPHEVFQPSVKKARLLQESQFTFKKYLADWDLVLKKSGLEIGQMLFDDELLSPAAGKKFRKKRLLLLSAVISSLFKLDQKWSLTTPKQPGEPRFYELVDLILDDVLPKEALVEIFASQKPDIARITRILNQRQSFLDLRKPYTFLREQNQGLIEIGDPYDWLNKALDIKPQVPAGEDLLFLEFGELSEPAPPNRCVTLDLSSNPGEIFRLALLQLWLHGASIEWPRLYPEGTFDKVPLPAYDFDRQSFWLSGKTHKQNDLMEDAAGHHTRQVYSYKPTWIRQDPPAVNRDVNRRAALVFINGHSDNNPLEKSLVKEAGTAYQKVFSIRQGPSFVRRGPDSFEIMAQREHDYSEVMSLIDGEMDEGTEGYDILYLWSCESEAFPAGDERELAEKQEKGVQGFFFLARALTRIKMKSSIKVVAATCQSQVVTPQDKGEGYGYGGLSGLAKTIGLENPRVKTTMIDFAAGELTPDEMAAILVREAISSQSEGMVACRNKDRYLWTIGPVSLAPEECGEFLLKDKGVYLLIGGAGGIGLKVAETITQKVRARLVLVGRSEQPDSLKREKLVQLQSRGSEVLYLSGDATSQEHMQTILRTIKERYGELHGVINAGGILEDKLLLNKDWASFQRVMSPKVQGTWILNQLTQKEPLDFFVVFSSVVAVLGNQGQADYAAANSFMDAFIQYRSRNNFPGKSLSINWTLWADGGMGKNPSAVKAFAGRTGIIDSQAASMAFSQLLHGLQGQYIIAANPHCFPVEKEKVPPSLLPVDLPSLDLQNTLVELLAAILNIDPKELDNETDLRGFGLDSFSLTEYAEHIKARLGIDINAALLFEYTTIKEISEYLQEQCAAHSVQKPHPAQPCAYSEPCVYSEGDRVSEATAEDIAIIGMSGRFPGSRNLSDFWNNLREGRDLIREVPSDRWNWEEYFGDPRGDEDKTDSKWGGFLEDIQSFDAGFFGISPREAELMDPQQRLLLEESWHAIEDAGYPPSALSGTRTGVFIGVCNDDYNELVLKSGVRLDAYTSTGSYFSLIPNRISYFLNIHGPSVAVDTACSSSLVAIHQAIQAINNQDCVMALAGGVNICCTPRRHISFSHAGMLSVDGRCKTFDRKANGYVRGEGVGIIFLKPLEKAREDKDHIYGIIKASAVNHGGLSNSLTAPNPKAQAELLISAYEKAKVDPGTITFIEAHGTGTSLGDPIEINGLKKAFEELYTRWNKPQPHKAHCGLSSIKTNIGHLEPAAGIASLIKVLLSMKHGRLPATLHFDELNPYIQLEGSPFYIVKENLPWESLRDNGGNILPRRAGISSFGIGGVNAHIVIEEYLPPVPQHKPVEHNEPKTGRPGQDSPIRGGRLIQNPQIIVLSAKNEERLKAYAAQMMVFITKAPASSPPDVSINLPDVPVSLTDLAYALQVGREALEERLALLVSSREELLEKLSQYCQGKAAIRDIYTGNTKTTRAKVGHLVTGRAGREFIADLVRDKDFPTLVQLWVLGVEIDWKLLYQDFLPNRIPLPAYPFAREKYWIPASGTSSAEGSLRHLSDKPDCRGQMARLHPLLDKNVSTLREQRFSTLLAGDEFFLADHVVDERKILPGVAYLEMARAAGELSGERRVRKLENIVWVRPISLSKAPQEMHISLYPNQDRTNNHQAKVEYEVSTTDESNKRIVHAQGKLIYEDSSGSDAVPGSNGASHPMTIDINAIRERCRASMESSECYRMFQTRGVKYGPSFRAIREIFSNGKEALSYLELPSNLKPESAEFTLHPVLMDGALQTAAALMKSREAGPSGPSGPDNTYLPFALGEVEIIHPLPQACYVHVTEDNHHLGKSPVTRFNLHLADKSGQVLVRMKDFSLRALKHTGLEQEAGRLRNETAPTAPAYYHPVWKPSDIDFAATAAAVREQLNRGLSGIVIVIVFDINQDLRTALEEKLKREGRDCPVVLVMPGKSFRKLGDQIYEINPGQKQDYLQFSECLDAHSALPITILHLWAKIDLRDTPSCLDYSAYSLLYLCQALVAKKSKDKISLLYLYRSQEVAPHHAAISGLVKTFHLENPRLAGKTVHIRAASGQALSASKISDITIAELLAEDGPAVEVRYEHGHRYVKSWQELEIERKINPDQPPALLKEGGVYVITGGLGGLGFIFARYLAGQVRAKLVLAGRSDLSAGGRDRIIELESQGAEAVYTKTDIAQKEQAQALIADARQRFGRIDGIIHSAGVLRDSLLMKKTRDEMEAVLAPKVYGTVYLDEASAHDQLDFFVLFSSIASVTGNVGQSDYAYANSFMDNFAEKRESLRTKGERFGRTLSINWPLWQEGGMKVNEQTETFLARTLGLQALRTQDGIAAFAWGLACEGNQLLVAGGDRGRIHRVLGLAEESPLQEPAGIPGLSSQVRTTPDTSDKIKTGKMRIDGEALRHRLQRDLPKIAANILKIREADIDPESELNEYGFDSISLTEFANRINDKYDLEITPAIFFEYLSLDSLARYLSQEYKDKLIHLAQDNLKAISQVVSRTEGADGAALVEIRPAEETRPRFPAFGQERVQQDTGQGISQGSAFRQPSSEPVAIIGMAGAMPQSDDLETFWKHLEKGRDLITEIPPDRWDWRACYGDPAQEDNTTNVKWGGFMKAVDKFDAAFFGISPREAELMDPQQRIFLQTAWEAIEDAGYKPSDLSGTRTGLFVGVANIDYQELLRDHGVNIEALTSTGRSHSILANRISFLLNLHGPSEPIDTACSSSLVAIHRAAETLHTGGCEMAIAGGVNVILSPTLYISFSKAGMLCEDGRCKTFDRRANGYVRGEGVGAVLLKPLSRALADNDHIYALIKATAENHGGHASSLTAPNPNAQAQLLVSAYEKAQIDPATVSYIEAHGTGTSLGDPIEINGLKKAFEELYKKRGKTLPLKPHCGLGSVKTNIGHLETAAGIASIIKVVLAMQHKTLPATVHFEELNPYIQLEGSPFYVVKETRPWEPLKGDDGRIIPRRAGVSSFGFGGANAHIVLEEYTPATPAPLQPGRSDQVVHPQIIVLSARNEEGLKLYAARMARFLEKAPISLTDLAYTLQVGREAMNERLAVVVSGIRELIDRLDRYCQDQSDSDADRENVYRGRVDKEKADLLVTGKEGEEFIRIIVTERKLDKLARLWVSGIEIDWRLLYLTSAPSRLALPACPFIGQRYWIPAPAGPMGHTGKAQPLHPFLDGIDPKASLVEGLAFKKTLHRNDLILRDHKVRGQSTLPGVAYLEMAYAAVSAIKQSHNTRSFNLERVVWLQPLTLKEAKKEIHLIITRGIGQLSYEVQSSSSSHPVTHAKGVIGLSDSPAERIEQAIRTEEIQTKCAQRIDRETLYAAFRQTGIDYGPYFQGLDQVWINADEALGHFNLPLPYEHELRQYTLHPVLMDCALQTIGGLITCLEGRDGQLLLPFAAERVEVFHPLQASGYAYVKALGNYRFHVAILDESGLVCSKLHEVALRESAVPAVQLKSFFYLPFWKQSPLKSAQASIQAGQAGQIRKAGEERGKKDHQTVIIIYPPQGLKLAEILSRFHPKDEVVRIRLGGSATKRISPGHWEVRTGEPAGLDLCMQQVKTVQAVYFLGGIQTQRIDKDWLASLEKSQEEGVLSLFRLIKALSRRKLLHRSFQLKVITNDTHQISSEEIINPYSASLFGLARVIAKEYPAVQVSCLDIRWDEIAGKASAEMEKALGEALGVPASPPPQENAAGGPKESAAGGAGGGEAALREGKRYVRTLEPVFLPPVPASQTPLRFRGVYLILGGAGGIGLELSRYLAETVQARLVLLGRSRLTAEQKEKISAIEAKGAKVLYLQAEATDLESMREAVTTARSHFGRINGVIHSALILKDRTLENMDEETFQAALGPKVRGSVILSEVIKGERLDFILFFSSSQSFLSNAGQSNYAAGCTFKDAFALYLNQQEPYPVKIINWGYWGSVGVVSSEEYNRLLAAQGFHSIEPEEGMEAVHRVLGHKEIVQVTAVKAEDHTLEEMGVDQHHRIEILPEDIPSTIKTMTSEVNRFLDKEAQGEDDDEDQREDDDQRKDEDQGGDEDRGKDDDQGENED